MSPRLYNKKKVLQNEIMFMKPGTTFVYTSYDTLLYYLNIVSQGDDATVLLGAIEPLENGETMTALWKQFTKNSKKTLKTKNMCNGLSQLCISFGIDIESCSKQDLTSRDGMWVEEDEKSSLANRIVCAPRLGFMCLRDLKTEFLRFYNKRNHYVSMIDKTESYVIIRHSQIKN